MVCVCVGCSVVCVNFGSCDIHIIMYIKFRKASCCLYIQLQCLCVLSVPSLGAPTNVYLYARFTASCRVLIIVIVGVVLVSML